MSDQYLGQIEIFAFDYAPRNWAACAGQLLPINQYQALFSLLGTTYGGNGTTNFALPDLRSRLAVGQGTGQGLSPYNLGQAGGEENHTLSIGETPSHFHPLNVISNPTPANNTENPGTTVVLTQTTGKVGSTNPTVPLYVADTNPSQTMAQASIGVTGGQPHANTMPYLAVNFCISLIGVFPSRN